VIEQQRRLAALNAAAVIVVCDEPDLVRRTMLAGLHPPFPVLVDPERSAYRAWGLRRASAATILFDPKVWRQYWRLLRSGERWQPAGRDVLQLGGDFVIAPDMTISYARPQRRDDRPPVGLLLRELARVAPSA